MTDAPSAGDRSPQDRTRQRRFITAVLLLVIAIGAVGVVAALVVGNDSTPGTTTATPGASIDPFSVEGLCRSDGVASFEVAADPKSAPEFTATGAVEPWVRSGETSQTTSTGEDSKLVAISKPGELPRVVLTVERAKTGWTITGTAGCLEAGKTSCTPTLTVRKATYARSEVSTTDTTPDAKFLGNGALTFTGSDAGCTLPAAPRGEIAPVSAYAGGSGQAVLVTDGAADLLP